MTLELAHDDLGLEDVERFSREASDLLAQLEPAISVVRREATASGDSRPLDNLLRTLTQLVQAFSQIGPGELEGFIRVVHQNKIASRVMARHRDALRELAR